MDACCNKRRQAHLSSSSSLLWRTELRMLSELFCTDRLISDPGWRQGGRRYDSLTPLWKKDKKHLNSKNIPPIMMAKKEKVPHRSWWLHPLCVSLLPIVCATDGSRNQNRKSLQEKKKRRVKCLSWYKTAVFSLVWASYIAMPLSIFEI